MENLNKKKTKLSERYEIILMAISVLLIVAFVTGLTLFPEEGNALANSILKLLTHTFGSPIMIITLVILLFLIGICFTKYGDIRLGNEKPKYKTITWVAMMFFCGNGAGTVYWAFLEWGHFFNASPQLNGAEIDEAMKYELSMAYDFMHWGPSAWAMLCVFALPFAYHYHIKKDEELKLSAICKYAVGEKHTHGLFGKIVDFIFIFAAVGSISITAGTSASTIASALSDLLGIPNTFALSVVILLFVAVIYSFTSAVGIEKGMSKISDSNVYLCMVLLAFILIAGPTGFIIDSMLNSLGLMFDEFVRMSTWTDPVNGSGFPQDWTVFYWIYWFTFGPFTGLYVAKISKGRKIKEIIINMLCSGSMGLILFFGIVGGYEQSLRIDGILDVPGMLANGEAESIAVSVINTLPFSKIALILYLFVIVLFLATTLDACAFTLSSTVSKKLRPDEEPNKGLKFAWCLILILLPIAVTYAGTNIDTIKSIVLATGLPLVVLLFIVYFGFLKTMRKDYRGKTKLDIIKESKLEK